MGQRLIESRKEFKGAVIGTLLGDSCLSSPSEGNCRLTFAHVDQEYSLFKAGLLKWLTNVTLYTDKEGLLRVYTARHPFYTKLSRWIYYDGRKTVTAHAMKSLTPLGLALWYMDDGDMHKDKMDVKLWTNSFNEAEHMVMTKYLNDMFSLRFSILRKDEYFYLRLKNSDRERFFSLIEPYVVPSMRYKVPTAEGMEKIRTKSRLSKSDVDEILKPEVLDKLYHDSGLSIYRMSKVLNINSGTILGRLRKAGFEIRDSGKYSPSRYILDSQATVRTGLKEPVASVSWS